MAKAADNADWKARWGSVHHTDRTLLAHYRASLKSAIQRKANITQAISRYEKLLNRTQKAATDIKRLRPLVEDAINKGIQFTIGEGELMAHDVPLGCAPDEYDDLISGTCSHLP
nr:hypothetical protein [Escherichia coli]